MLVDSPVFVRFDTVIIHIGDVKTIVGRVEKREWMSGVTTAWVIRRG